MNRFLVSGFARDHHAPAGQLRGLAVWCPRSMCLQRETLSELMQDFASRADGAVADALSDVKSASDRKRLSRPEVTSAHAQRRRAANTPMINPPTKARRAVFFDSS